jgi:hypothetical protein
MIAPVYTLILTPKYGSKKVWPPQKNPKNDEYVVLPAKNKIFFLKQGFFRN